MFKHSRFDRWEAPDHTFRGHRDILVRNLARYDFVAPLLKGRLLDLGCGRAYGLERLMHQAPQVGVDVSSGFLRDARRRLHDLPLACASGERLPFANHSFDSVISFEVIEHIQEDAAFLREVKRVALPGGFLALSTPNRLFASGHREEPLNVWHCREYTGPEFLALLSGWFDNVEFFSQYEVPGGAQSKLVDRVPIAWKYLLPTPLQDLLSVTLRPPLQEKDCHFEAGVVNQAHTFLALIRV